MTIHLIYRKRQTAQHLSTPGALVVLADSVPPGGRSDVLAELEFGVRLGIVLPDNVDIVSLAAASLTDSDFGGGEKSGKVTCVTPVCSCVADSLDHIAYLPPPSRCLLSIPSVISLPLEISRNEF